MHKIYPDEKGSHGRREHSLEEKIYLGHQQRIQIMW